MNEPSAPTASTSSRGIFVAIFLVLVVITGGIFALRDRMLAEIDNASAEQSAEREKLANQLAKLQLAVDSLEAIPNADSEGLTSLTNELTELHASQNALAARIEALEQTLAGAKPVSVPAPATQTPAPSPAEGPTAKAPTTPTASPALQTLRQAVLSGKPFEAELKAVAALMPERDLTALYAVASDGITSETTLVQALREAIDASHAAMDEENGTIGKLNSHLKGLVSIRKSDRNAPYAALREDIRREDLETLIRQVERLTDAERAPLDAWLKRATAHRAALSALNELSPASH